MEITQALQSIHLRVMNRESIETLLPDIEKISEEVLRTRNPQAQFALVQVVVAVRAIQGVKVLELDDDSVQTTVGGINQFTGEVENSACTCIAQCALRRILSIGRAWDVQKEEVDAIVRDGKLCYKLLHDFAKKTAEAVGIRLCQALSNAETESFFGLGTLSSEGGKVLQIEENSTIDFFKKELLLLETMFGEHGNIGGIIHSKEKTFAVALLNQGDYVEYVLFDSHGCSELNEGSENAFFKITRSRDNMAQLLATLCPYTKCEVDDLSAADISEIEKESNPYILYVVKLIEKGFPAETSTGGGPPPQIGEPEPVDPPSSPPPKQSAGMPPEPKPVKSSSPPSKPNPKVQEWEREMQERRVRILVFLLSASVLTSGYAYRKPLNMYVWQPIRTKLTGSKSPPVLA